MLIQEDNLQLPMDFTIGDLIILGAKVAREAPEDIDRACEEFIETSGLEDKPNRFIVWMGTLVVQAAQHHQAWNRKNNN